MIIILISKVTNFELWCNRRYRLSILKNLEVLEILYTLDSGFIKIVKNDNIKKFIISGDLVDKDSKKYINSLKSKGLKIEIVGPVIW
jgi:hypothetical protein